MRSKEKGRTETLLDAFDIVVFTSASLSSMNETFEHDFLCRIEE